MTRPVPLGVSGRGSGESGEGAHLIHDFVVLKILSDEAAGRARREKEVGSRRRDENAGAALEKQAERCVAFVALFRFARRRGTSFRGAGGEDGSVVLEISCDSKWDGRLPWSRQASLRQGAKEDER
jgi:hypothetical protein